MTQRWIRFADAKKKTLRIRGVDSSKLNPDVIDVVNARWNRLTDPVNSKYFQELKRGGYTKKQETAMTMSAAGLAVPLELERHVDWDTYGGFELDDEEHQKLNPKHFKTEKAAFNKMLADLRKRKR